jgi:hypothetical protein
MQMQVEALVSIGASARPGTGTVAERNPRNVRRSTWTAAPFIALEVILYLLNVFSENILLELHL